ncbi:hypothetical protein PybrP1_008404 [[Pythium] brassicae (nom. inval.)]|nr:hypothetical protein PybrP1_008404 [[Pythium] brassicae (nom. inval.)]
MPKLAKDIARLQFSKALNGAQSFLGSLKYYHKFIKDFSVLAPVLNALSDDKYHDAEKEVLALLRVLNVFYTILTGQHVRVFMRYPTLNDEDGLAAIVAASITPRERLDAVTVQLVPLRASRTKAPPISLEMLGLAYEGHLLSFNGAAKLKSSPRSAGFVLWKLPGWDTVEARELFLEGVAVNEAEYHRLLAGLQSAADSGVSELVIVGDSRTVVQQAQTLIKCNTAGVQRLLAQYESTHFVKGELTEITQKEAWELAKTADLYVLGATGTLVYFSNPAKG